MNANSQIIQPSSFNRRITVKESTTTTDAGGGTSSIQNVKFETWASVDSLSTSRKVYLGFDAFASVYEIRLRRTPDRDISVSNIVDYEGRSLVVKSVQLVRQSYKTFNILICEEVDPNG